MADYAPPVMGDDRDVVVGQDPDGSEITVLGLLSAFESESDTRLRCVRQRALRNERYVLGDHRELDDADPSAVAVYDGLDDVSPVVTRNYVRALHSTWCARLLEDRPTVTARPNEASADIGAAEIADALISYQHEIQDLDDLHFELVGHAQYAGAAAIKVVWDPESGPLAHLDESGPSPMGDVRWSIATVFDWAMDPMAQREDEALWCTFARIVDKHLAWAMLRDAGIDEEPLTDDGSSVERSIDGAKGVKVCELWHRPCPRLPDGLYAVVVGGHVIDARAYPYDHMELPISVFRIAEKRGSGTGAKTHLDDAIHLQREINEIVEAIQRMTRECANVRLLLPDSIADSVEDGNHIIRVASKEAAETAKWLEPPRPPPLLFSQLEEKVHALHAIFGLNEMLTGADSMKSGTAAKTIAYLSKLDSMKLSGAARSFGRALRRAWRQTLRLTQQYVTDERMIQVAGPDKELYLVPFRGAELGGVDVRLEPSTGIERYRASQAAQAEEDAAAGWLPPDQAAERRQTGLRQTAGQALDAQLVTEQIQAVLGGAAQPEALQDVDPATAIRLIQVALSSYASVPGAREALTALAAAYAARQSTDQQALAQEQQAIQQIKQPQNPAAGLQTGVP